MQPHTINAVLDRIMELILDNEIDKAIVAIVRTEHAIAMEARYEAAEAAAAEDELPPVRGYRRKLRSIDVSCPTCKAKPGKGCFEMTRRGPGAEPTDKLRDAGYHKTRTRKAKERS